MALVKFGYAPGDYYCGCRKCGKSFIGDKRATVCKECATIESKKPEKTCIVINLYGGPGTGKSTMAARLFSELKMMNHNCELVTEYAKRKVWEDSYRTLENQIYVFGKQQYAMWCCAKHVELIVTDSPLILSNIYGGNDLLKKLVNHEFKKYHNINIFLKRVKLYNPKGRTQSEDEAKELDHKIKNMLESEGYLYSEFDGSFSEVESILEHIKDEIVYAYENVRFVC